MLQIDTPLAPGVLLVRSLQGREAISQIFEIDVELASEHFEIEPQTVLSKPVTLRISVSDTEERYINGFFSRFTLAPARGRLARYHARIVPALWFLTRTTNCCIFQNRTTPEIIEAIFQKYCITNYRLHLDATYAKREYCVQYRETAFDFISRLMEEEGICYYFKHTSGTHVMVLADSLAGHPACELGAEVRWEPGSGFELNENSNYIQDWVRTLEVRPRKWTQQDFQFKKPATQLSDCVPTLSDNPGPDLEKYDYPGHFGGLAEAGQLTRVRMEEEEAAMDRIRGESNCRGFTPGYTFSVKRNFRTDQAGSFLLVACHYEAAQGSLYVGDNGHAHYHNRFSAIPAQTVFRPPRTTARPFIRGLQTAFVTGPGGEEIYVDHYGRVKVQFHWDREGHHDGASSCWVRVSQSVAGKGWGAMQIPRVGHEVIVEFLEGNPDRPVITGNLYNADHETPYPLPDERSKTTLKTLSYPGGGGFNEIRLDDKKGSEQVFIHGEKDVDVRNKNDYREWVGNDRHVIAQRDKLERIGRDRHETVKRDEIKEICRDHHLTVSGKQALSIQGSQSIAVAGDVIEQFRGNQSTEVTGACYVKGMNVVVEALAGLTIKVGGSFLTINASGIQMSGPMVLINSGGSALSGNAGNLVSPLSPAAPAVADDGKPGDKGAIPGAGGSETSGTGSNGALSNAPWHDSTTPANKKKKSWIEIELVDHNGKPVPGEPYRITLPDGATAAEGTVDDKGRARVDGIDPGTCKVTFPKRDKQCWQPK